MRKKTLTAAWLTPALLCLTQVPAHAYVDPGVGGMFYQILLLAGVAVAGFFAAFRTKISAYFSRKKDPAKAPHDGPTD